MIKKIYGLLASILILSACTDEIYVDPQLPVGESEVAVSFSLDAPVQVVSKSAAVPVEEGADPNPWVNNLVLYTFDEDAKYIEPVIAKPVSSGSSNYTAVIKKATRSIYFVSNYGETDGAIISGLTAGTTTVSNFESLPTTEYVYAKKVAFNPASSSLGTIELLRNWSRLSLTNISTEAEEGFGITNVSYYVYSNPQNATYVEQTGESINMPASNVWNRPTSEPAATEWIDPAAAQTVYSYLRENNNFDTSTATFLIVKGTFLGDGATYYYKIDISNTDENNITTLYNIERNKWYQISIYKVLQKGVSTWAEVIDPSKLPDNNLMAAAEISDYPKVAYDGYTLEIFPKTTYVFTDPTPGVNQLDFDVEYRDPSEQLINGQISDLYFPRDISNVVNGNVTLNKTTGKITAQINDVVPGEVKETEFYIIAGELQRRIKLILRDAYDFVNVSVTPNNPATIGATVNVHFELPMNQIDRSIFPLEVAIRSNKLYSVESGVRIDTYSNGDYAYIYTIQEQDLGDGKFDVSFKTAEANPNEYITINALNFKESFVKMGNPTSLEFANVSTSKTGNTITLKFTTPVHPTPYTVSIDKPADLDGVSSYTVTRQGEHTITYTTSNNDADTQGEIKLFATDFINKSIQFRYGELLLASSSQRVIKYPWYSSWVNVPNNAVIVTSIPGVVVSVSNSRGEYSVTIPAGTMMNQPISIYYRSSSTARYKVVFASITDFYNSTGTIQMVNQ
ncbi:hypothetical protein LJC57_06470 [Parabacteroides sp. OttesenSCG-928-G07]|nr:hypothetical protein [Parabacteroides sp. OttesenSCG-928-G07]